MSKRSFVASLIGACAALSVLAIPAAASASSLWVSNTTSVSSPKNSCIHPGYSTIQSAVTAAESGATIHVCPGTYTEQLTITEPLKFVAVDAAGSAKVVLPATPVDSITACDAASLAGLKKLAEEQREREELEKGEPVAEGQPQPDQDAVSICTTGTVAISGLTFEPKWAGSTCDDSLYGILVGGGATLVATNVAVDGGGAYPINGCQGGVAIQVGMAWASPVEVGHATMTHDSVAEYQKNGITVDGAGSSAKIATTIVTGAGATTQTAQNGIQVSNGAKAAITSSTISGNECDNVNCGSNAFEKTQATGVLFYGAAAGSNVTDSTLEENDIGAYFESASPTQPHKPEVTISKDAFTGDRYEGVALDHGDASVTGDVITGPGNIGIDLFQYKGQPYAPTSSAASDEIDGMSDAAVKVQSDKAAGDPAGSFTITKSLISGNAQAVEDESETFKVVI